MRIIGLLLTLLLSFCVSCGQIGFGPPDREIEKIYSPAEDMYNGLVTGKIRKSQANWNNVIRQFGKVVKNHSKSRFADDAQYKIGASYIQANGIIEDSLQKAIKAFDRLIKRYPDSEFVDDAYYWKAHAHFLREDYEQAITEFDRLPRKLGIISQTTQSPDRFANFAKRLIDLGIAQVSELRLINTICDVTRKRQVAALKLAGTVDLMIVVGGHNSANTQRLAEICSTTGVETHRVEGVGEIEPGWLQGHHRIGVTAGASTPDEVINEVMLALEGLTGDC